MMPPVVMTVRSALIAGTDLTSLQYFQSTNFERVAVTWFKSGTDCPAVPAFISVKPTFWYKNIVA